MVQLLQDLNLPLQTGNRTLLNDVAFAEGLDGKLFVVGVPPRLENPRKRALAQLGDHLVAVVEVGPDGHLVELFLPLAKVVRTLSLKGYHLVIE